MTLSEPTKNIVALAESVPDLSTLVTALKAGKLVDTLSGTGPFTVFAPTNQAFAELPPQVLKHLLEPANIKQLQAVLEYHVVSGAIKSTDLKPEQQVKTLEGSDLEIRAFGGHVEVNDAHVLKADNLATNGVVHIISKVLIPKKVSQYLKWLKYKTVSVKTQSLDALAKVQAPTQNIV